MSDDEELFPGDETPDDKSDREFISELLDQYRPQRYDPDDKRWQGPVEDAYRDRLANRPEAVRTALDKLVERSVRQVEGLASRRVNNMLRLLSEGRDALGGEEFWPDACRPYLPAPIAFEHRKLTKGKTIKQRIRVRFAAMTPTDWTELYETSAKESDARASAEKQAREGILIIRDRITESGKRTTEAFLKSLHP
jgi:hypothetical protein